MNKELKELKEGIIGRTMNVMLEVYRMQNYLNSVEKQINTLSLHEVCEPQLILISKFRDINNNAIECTTETLKWFLVNEGNNDETT